MIRLLKKYKKRDKHNDKAKVHYENRIKEETKDLPSKHFRNFPQSFSR